MDQDTTLHVCSICGREFRPRDAETLICPDCGGPPEAPAPSQPQETVSSNGSQGMAQANRQVSTSPQEWQEGDVILDLYEVKGEVGRGGLAAVYRVHHRRWNMDLAVKTPLPEALQKAGSLENFLREAQAWVDLGLHPHIVTCYYVRRVGDVPCMFTEYIEGGSLKDWIENGRLYAGDEREALKRILDVAIQFAWGLEHVHQRGFVHQNAGPGSALMTSDGRLKLAGFELLGGKGYPTAQAAPEQELGQAVSPRTDIWGWGVSVLEMFTGEVHWGAGSTAAAVLENYLQEAPPEGIPPMPAALAELLRQCFQNDPDQRPASMDEVAERLMRLYEQETGAPYPRPKPQALELRADSLNNKAVSLLDLGLEEEAVRCWQEALQADPAHLEANFNYGYYRWQRAEVLGSEFLKQLQRLEATHGSDLEYWRLLAWVYLEQGYVEEVEEILEKRGVEDEALRRAHRDPNRPVGREVRRFEGHTDRVTSVAFSPDVCYRTENPFVSCRVAHRFAGKRKLTGTRLPSRWA
jgi:serine/threonine protein kinase